MYVERKKERKKGRIYSSLIFLYKGLKGAASIPTDYLITQLGAVEIITHFDFSYLHSKNRHLKGLILSSNK